ATEELAVKNDQCAVRSTAERVRLLQYRIEHWPEVARRGVDHAQNLGSGGFPLQCLVTFVQRLVKAPAQVGNLVLEVSIGLFKISQRAVRRPAHVRSRRNPSEPDHTVIRTRLYRGFGKSISSPSCR